MGVTWFLDLAGNQVVENSRPAGKIYVVDPEKLLEPEWINFVVTPEPYEQVVRTNSDLIEEMAAHSGAHTSKGEARRAGFSGSPYHGLELYGPINRSFWIWCPEHPKKAPTFPKKKLRTNQWWEFLQTLGWVNRVRAAT